MAAGFNEDDPEEKTRLEEFGLDGEFSFEIMAVAEVMTHDASLERMIKLRDPWTRFQWNGDWSANSPCWTEQAKK